MSHISADVRIGVYAPGGSSSSGKSKNRTSTLSSDKNRTFHTKEQDTSNVAIADIAVVGIHVIGE